MKKVTPEEYENIIAGLKSLLDVRSSLKEIYENHHSCKEDEDEEENEENQFEFEKAKKYHKEYQEMMEWAIANSLENGECKEKVVKRWKRLHPDLPELFLPNCITNEASNVIFNMQVIPHWEDFKKKNKKEKS